MIIKEAFINGRVFFGQKTFIFLDTNEQNFWVNGQSVNFVFSRSKTGSFIAFLE